MGNLTRLKPGDVVLVKNNTLYNFLVRFITRSEWGHVALYVGSAVFIEAAKDGVVLKTEKQYQKAKVSIYRSPLKESSINTIISHALQYEGAAYDFLGVLQLFILTLIGKRSTALQIGDKKRYFCSELIARVYKDEAVEVIPGLAPDKVFPSDFSISPNFTRVE